MGLPCRRRLVAGRPGVGSARRRPSTDGAPDAASGAVSVEAVLAVPVMVLVVLVAIQIGLWALASEAVGQAASRVVTVAAALGGSPTRGLQAGRQELAALAGHVVVHPGVTITSPAPGLVQASVVGQAEAIVPWLDLRVSAVRQATVQGFRPWP